MANKLDNLKGKGHKLTIEDKKKGGRNSVIARAEKKSMRELAEDVLSLELKGDGVAELQDAARQYGYDTSGWTAKHYAVFAQGLKAVKGDLSALMAMADFIGEKPADKQVLTVEELPTINIERAKPTK